MLHSCGCGHCKSLKTYKDISLILIIKFMHANNLIFLLENDGQGSRDANHCWVLDLDIFTFTNISQHSGLVVKEIANAMNNDYVVGIYYTGHWVTLIICMKLKEV
jgi:hypothetical protein